MERYMKVTVPMWLFNNHGAQADDNHGQSLNRLAERGGLSVCEAVAILEDRPWQPMTQNEAVRRLGELLAAGSD